MGVYWLNGWCVIYLECGWICIFEWVCMSEHIGGCEHMWMHMYASVDRFLCLFGWVYVALWMGVGVYLWMGLFKLHFLKQIRFKSKT